MKNKINYKEGTWFAIPLRQGGYGIGVIARIKKPFVLVYLFGQKHEAVPKIEQVIGLKSHSCLTVLRVGDLGLLTQKWPIIGNDPLWNRLDWPMPIFVRHEPLRPFRTWRVHYSDMDPGEVISEELECNDKGNLPEDSFSGYGAAEIKISKLLDASTESANDDIHFSASQKTDNLSQIPIEGGPFRVEVIQQLRSFGSDTSKLHSFDFYLYLPSRQSALSAATKIREEDFSVEVGQSTNGHKWLCTTKANLVPETAPLDEIERFLKGVANEFHGEFDGWESDVVKG